MSFSPLIDPFCTQALLGVARTLPTPVGGLRWAGSPRLAVLPTAPASPALGHSGQAEVVPAADSSCTPRSCVSSWPVFLVGAQWRAEEAFSVSCWGGEL